MSEMLLQAIREQPDDDLARLACADWFEEQGQAARGAMIRVQIEQARLPQNDPYGGPLAIRAHTLAAEHEKAWLGEWTDRLVRWSFRRGFLDSVVLEPHIFLAYGNELFRSHPIREVQFVAEDGRPCGSEVVADLVASPAFAQVRALDVTGSIPAAGPAWCRALAGAPHLTRLEELNFSSNWRPEAVFNDADALERLCQANHLRNLRRLSLAAPMSHGALGDEVVDLITAAVFAGRLRSLNLGGRPLTDQAIRTLAGSGKFQNLRSLELGWCEHLSREGIQALLDSTHMRSLEELSLSGDFDVSAIARAPLLGQMQELSLNTNTNRYFRTFSPGSWADLAHSPHAARLRRLNLLYNLLDEEGAARLFQTSGTLRLHSLMMMGMQGSGDVLAGLIASSPALTELTSLELPGCNITVAGMQQLLSAPFIRQLSLFCVAGNTIQSRGLQALLRSGLRDGQLTELHLHHCRLRPGGLRKLLGWRGLLNVTKLELGNNNFDRDAMNTLLASPYAKRLTTLHLGSGEVQADALEALARSTGLPRLRNVTVPENTDGSTLAALRERFGPRLSHDPLG